MTGLVRKCLGSMVIMCFITTAASAETWAVWKRNISTPGTVLVAPLGSLSDPWNIDSVWHENSKGAWKKACWLVRNGDLLGRRYLSPRMESGEVTCDSNCNCKF